jgi:hypothetical protein
MGQTASTAPCWCGFRASAARRRSSWSSSSSPSSMTSVWSGVGGGPSAPAAAASAPVRYLGRRSVSGTPSPPRTAPRTRPHIAAARILSTESAGTAPTTRDASTRVVTPRTRPPARFAASRPTYLLPHAPTPPRTHQSAPRPLGGHMDAFFFLEVTNFGLQIHSIGAWRCVEGACVWTGPE